jgi:hypothetical protein
VPEGCCFNNPNEPRANARCSLLRPLAEAGKLGCLLFQSRHSNPKEVAGVSFDHSRIS